MLLCIQISFVRLRIFREVCKIFNELVGIRGVRCSLDCATFTPTSTCSSSELCQCFYGEGLKGCIGMFTVRWRHNAKFIATMSIGGDSCMPNAALAAARLILGSIFSFENLATVLAYVCE